MGLDSVELLYTIEEAFDIDISNSEAETISIVDELVEAFYKKIDLKPSRSCLSQMVYYRLRKALLTFGYDRAAILPATRLSNLLDQKFLRWEWSMMEQEIDLIFPSLVKLDYDNKKNKTITILGYPIYERPKAITSHRLRELIDWIISLNHSQLIRTDQISNRYEVERVVMGIISENNGIPINQIQLHHHIGYDLGIE